MTQPTDKAKYKKDQLAVGDLVRVESPILGTKGLFLIEAIDSDGIHLRNPVTNEQVRTEVYADVTHLFKGV